MLPHADTDYQMEHFLAGPVLPDRAFLYRRVVESAIAEVTRVAPGRVLDVGSGVSKELVQLASMGWQAYAYDPSPHMLGFSKMWSARTGQPVRLVRGIGERLPFADASFDCVMCQGSLDHFASPEDFVRETARVLRQDGRAVIALANFDGLATRLGKLLHPVARSTRLHHCSDERCWEIPADHTFKGNWPYVRGLGGGHLRLERAYGVSVLCMFYGWGHLLHRMPGGVSQRLLRLGDGLAHRNPALSDMIISVWRRA
jgi:SAM-dependent methyltransferase